jgi:hypothetical protein
VAVSTDGTETADTSMQLHRASNSTNARSAEIIIRGANLSVPKVAQRANGDEGGSSGDASETTMWRIPTTSPINALRVSAGGGNPNGGTIYIFGR